MKKTKLHKKREFDYEKELQKMGADKGFVIYLLAKSFTLPFYPSVDFVHPSDRSEIKKLHQSNWKKMYRRAKALGGTVKGGDWRDRWKETKEQLKHLRKTKYVQTLFGFEPANTKLGFQHMKPTKPSQNRIFGAIWMLKTYFERLTKEKSKAGEGRPCWRLIAELIEMIYPIHYSSTDLASWWRKRKKDFEPWDGDTFLESDLEFYQRNKLELDKQCGAWFDKCAEWLTRVEKSEKGFQKTRENYREFSKE